MSEAIRGATTPAPNRRLVRNLFLTISGGVALTVATQAAAQAQDAGTASDGADAVGSGQTAGDVAATPTQPDSPPVKSGGLLGGIVVLKQDGSINNDGIGVARVGDNDGTGDDASNSAGLPTAVVSTGKAKATADRSSSNVQEIDGAGGTTAIDGLVVLTQDAITEDDAAAPSGPVDDGDGLSYDSQSPQG